MCKTCPAPRHDLAAEEMGSPTSASQAPSTPDGERELARRDRPGPRPRPRPRPTPAIFIDPGPGPGPAQALLLNPGPGPGLGQTLFLNPGPGPGPGHLSHLGRGWNRGFLLWINTKHKDTQRDYILHLQLLRITARES